jgi:hypothetical protein
MNNTHIYILFVISLGSCSWCNEKVGMAIYNILPNDVYSALARKKEEVSITTLMIVWYVTSIVHTDILDFIVLV